MAITITCPECKARFSGNERMAGKSAKCSKCGHAFTVAPLEELQAEAEAALAAAGAGNAAGGAAAEGNAAAVAIASAAATATAESNGKEDNIVFLCPNGHQLNGPSRLQGKPGQCPHCGAKFQIPSYDEHDDGAEEFPEEDIPTGTMVDDYDGDPLEEVEEFVEEPLENYDLIDEIHPMGSGILRPPVVGAHPLSHIFSVFWDSREENTVIEIHHGDAEIMAPVYFAPDLSHQEYGVFGLEEAGGYRTVIAIPWSKVNKVVARRVGELPVGLID